MCQRGRIAAMLAGLAVALMLALSSLAIGHVRKAAGPYSVELGWVGEPAYSGSRNAVEVHVEDSAGRPVADPRGSLRVEVSFGDARRDLALEPAGEAGRYEAAIVPTRPGTYAFHVTGTLRGRRIDVAATCSERTFECVEGGDAIQFPVADPAASELDRKLDRALLRARAAEDDAAQAQNLAIGALIAAALALVAACGLALRRARRG